MLQQLRNAISFTNCDAQSAKQQRSLEGLVQSRLGEGPQQGLSELARSSTHIPSAHAQALRVCKHVGLIWHAFSHFRQILQVPSPSSDPCIHCNRIRPRSMCIEQEVHRTGFICKRSDGRALRQTQHCRRRV